MSDKKQKDEKSPFAGALADKLKSLDIEPSEKKDPQKEGNDAERREDQRPENPRPELDPPPPQSEQAQDELSDEELFEQAVEELAPEDVYRGKFHGQGPEFPEQAQPGSPTMRGPSTAKEPEQDQKEPSDEEARRELDELREMRQFEKAVGPVDKEKIPRGKYRRPSTPDPEEVARKAASYRSDSPEMITPPLPKSGEGLNQVGPLDASQKDMLARYKKRNRRHDVPELNIRGDIVEDALRQVELFVHQRWKEGAHFVRVIHGRGLQSDGDPVLKPAVLRWLEGPGFRYVKGYVPEVNSGGDYGSLIVELEKKS